MTIRLLDTVRIAGVSTSANTVVTLTDQQESDLVSRGLAQYEFSPRPVVRRKFDVVVYGATPAGCCAAVQAARLGMRVLLCSENGRLGGLVGGGISHQDIERHTSKRTVPGIAREFFEMVARDEYVERVYSRLWANELNGEPRWFETAWVRMVSAEANITVAYHQQLGRVGKRGTRLTHAVFDSTVIEPVGSVDARVFIDATYHGDLIAAAGCTVSIGRESSSLYSESSAGVLAHSGWTDVAVDPYVTSGSAASGVLPGLSTAALEATGAGDGRVQAFTYRQCITSNSGNQVAFPDPETYSALNYELLGRQLAATAYTQLDGQVFTLYDLGIGSKFDLNNRGAMSLNFVSDECTEYVTATPARRRVIENNAKQWILGLLYFLKTDSRSPSALKTNLATYGFCADEWQATSGFAPEFYVREARRLVGDFVMNANNCTLTNGYTDEVAFGYYKFDGHVVRRIVAAGTARIEGSVASALTDVGYKIPYRVLLPKATECTNLMSPTCPSVSRHAWLSIRLEPVLMALGQAAGIGAYLAVTGDINVQAVNTNRVKKIQNIYGIWGSVVLSADGVYAQGTVTQSPGASWSATTTRFGFLATQAYSDGNTGKGKTMRFAPNLRRAGAYRVSFNYPPSQTGRANNVTVTIVHAGGTTTLTLSQLTTGQGGDWDDLGVYVFAAGTPSAHYVEIDTTGTSDFVVADAVRWEPV